MTTHLKWRTLQLGSRNALHSFVKQTWKTWWAKNHGNKNQWGCTKIITFNCQVKTDLLLPWLHDCKWVWFEFFLTFQIRENFFFFVNCLFVHWNMLFQVAVPWALRVILWNIVYLPTQFQINSQRSEFLPLLCINVRTWGSPVTMEK